jgi:hypothetical protein
VIPITPATDGGRQPGKALLMLARGRYPQVPHQLTSEVVLGKRQFIAAYEPDPAIAFRAATAEEAIRQLNAHMGELHHLLVGPRFPAPAPRPGRPSSAR